MADEFDDDAIEHIAAALRPLPPVSADARARVLVAVAADRAQRTAEGARRRGLVRRALVGALAALLVGVVWLERDPARAPASPMRPSPAPDVPVTSATTASNVGEVAAVDVQLVVRVPAARRVSVVGDFTGWDERQVPMTRDPASGLWSATVSVRPGRHVYAFVADDSVWMRDPRAPIARDADFGRPGSLLLVGRP